MVKYKNKFLIILLGVVFLACIMTLLIRNSINSKTFEDFIGKPNPNISKVVMFNGSNGKSVFTTDKSKIQKLVILLKNRSYYKASDQRGRDGFGYSYTFYIDNKKILVVSDSNGSVKIYGTYYNTTIVPNNGLKTWYNSLVTSSTVAQEFINYLYEVDTQKVADYKKLITIRSSLEAVDTIGSKGSIKADKTLNAKYSKVLQTFDRRIQSLMTKEAYEGVVGNRYNTLSSVICNKGDYLMRVKDFIFNKNLYGDNEEKAGYNYEVKLQYVSYDWKYALMDSTKGYVGISKGYVVLSKVNDQWKVSTYKLTVAPKLYQETIIKPQKK